MVSIHYNVEISSPVCTDLLQFQWSLVNDVVLFSSRLEEYKKHR